MESSKTATLPVESSPVSKKCTSSGPRRMVSSARPGTLSERAGMSKQAMNQLLRSLEGLGYIVRSNAPDEGRARIVRFTKRGHAAYLKIHDILLDIEREWSTELGPKDFAQLKELLSRVWESPLTRMQ
jgi:DNA-binding MarR family transcriptional regulator